MSFAGRDSGAKLLGSFQTSILHNVVQLLFRSYRYAPHQKLAAITT